VVRGFILILALSYLFNDAYALKPFIINYILSFISKKVLLRVLIDINTTNYEFINERII
jgi:hypothetical protein